MLDGCRVLDLSDERGQLCGMLLADLGADVVCIEPPGGSNARRHGPFADGARAPESSLFWWSYARNKRSAEIDLESAAGRERLLALAARADVWIESSAPGQLAQRGLGYADLSARNPGLVYVSITPFGQEGPKAHWPASDLTVLAAGGPLWLTGDHDRAPTRVRVPQGFHHASAEAAAAALVALHERAGSGLGQHVDVSAQQAVTIATQSDIVSAPLHNTPGKRYAGGMVAGPMIVRLVYPAADGHVSITHVFGSTIGPATARLMRCVCEDGFCDEAMRDKDWVRYLELILGRQESIEGFEAAKAAVAAWTASKTKARLLELSLERGLLIAPVATPRDVLESPQLEARAYFEALERPDGRGNTRVPGPWARLSRTPLRLRRRAPRVGEHTEEVLAELASPAPPPAPARARPGALPLEGVRILDFMWAIAGPMATRILADYGASVVRIESSTRVDACRTMRPFVEGGGGESAALFHTCNAGKRMLCLDLTRPEARGPILDLVEWADVVCESFSPGTMRKLGFDYETLAAHKPDIIMLSTCLMGQTGPLARYAGYGNLGASIGGFHELAGWADRPPAGPFGAYTDYIAPRFNAASLLAALEHRRRTGEGQHIDVSQAEVGLHFLAPALLALSANGEEWTRAGNRDELYAPHGCYPVEGEDQWIAIAVDGDETWRALCEELGAPELTADPRFADAQSRRDGAAVLDAALAERTRGRKGAELEAALVARGVPAHRVLDSSGLAQDPQLAFRGHFVAREEGDLRTLIEAPRSRLSRTPGRPGDAIPTLGRDNQWVLSELLGYDDERITELVVAGVLE